MRLLRLTALALVLALAAGCGSKSGGGNAGAAQTPVLDEVAGLLRAASETKTPTKVADLAKYEPTFPTGYRAVKSGDVVVVWGAKMAGEGSSGSGSGEVIAYEKKVPTEGGFVLLTSGTVKEMTADEFKAAPKAK